MLFELNTEKNGFAPLTGLSITRSIGGNEKNLENYLKAVIGDIIFPELLVFGNERSFQGEPDLFAVNGKGDQILFELKVDGHYDRGKVYQAMSYAQIFSTWRYEAMNAHFKKCFSGDIELIDAFEEHYGYTIDAADFNNRQKIIIISHSSSTETNAVTKYWKSIGIDIEEYFYRFYDASGKILVELSNELFFKQDSGSCWVNTCSRHFPNAVFDMVAHSKAAIYEERKGVIGKWMNKANIFLYHNGYGIVAAGKGTARIDDGDYSEYGVSERSIKMNQFISGVDHKQKKIVSWISVPRIKELLNRDFYFPNSIVTLGEKEAAILRKECEKTFQ